MSIILFIFGAIILVTYGILLHFVIVTANKSSNIINYKELDDIFLIETIVNIFTCSIYRIFESASDHTCIHGYNDKIFKQFLEDGNVPGWIRTYMIDVLEGKLVFENSILG